MSAFDESSLPNSADELSLDDEFNRRLVERVHPANWVNPVPDGKYNLVVIGAGTAGLVTAAGGTGLGAKVALIERYLMGGDCLNVGCVPSKALLSAARAAATVRRASDFGTHAPTDANVDFPSVMRRMRMLRESISPNDSARRFHSLGVDVYFGQASFLDSQTVQVGDRKLRFSKAVIATGTRPAIPDIPGLSQTGCLTNETIFSLTTLPSRLAVIGAGPIGCELAQAFARFGSRVHLIETEHGVLPREDADAAERVRASLRDDGVEIYCCGRDLRFQNEASNRQITVESHGTRHVFDVDQILVAAGRMPNVEGLNLDHVGVRHDRSGVLVNDFLQTSNKAIYAAGDICSRFKFTHAAEAMAKIVLQNSLFLGRARLSALTIPWCTYTQPELAHVGLTARELTDRGIPFDLYEQPFEHVDRAILDGTTRGFIKVATKRRSDHILGATIVADHAGEMISLITLAMRQNIGLGKIAKLIVPYPTETDAIIKVANAYRKTTLTPFIKRLFDKWLAWNRSPS